MPRPIIKDGYVLAEEQSSSELELDQYLQEKLNHDLYMVEVQGVISRTEMSKRYYI